MDKEGFSEEDFSLELELYDVVRPPTWQSWNLASSNLASSSRPSTSTNVTAPQTISNIPVLDPKASFWKNLETYCATSYDADDTDFIAQVLQDTLEAKMADFSLDDLERLAASIQQSKQ